MVEEMESGIDQSAMASEILELIAYQTETHGAGL
jgi:hypothetical protein